MTAVGESACQHEETLGRLPNARVLTGGFVVWRAHIVFLEGTLQYKGPSYVYPLSLLPMMITYQLRTAAARTYHRAGSKRPGDAALYCGDVMQHCECRECRALQSVQTCTTHRGYLYIYIYIYISWSVKQRTDGIHDGKAMSTKCLIVRLKLGRIRMQAHFKHSQSVEHKPGRQMTIVTS